MDKDKQKEFKPHFLAGRGPSLKNPKASNGGNIIHLVEVCNGDNMKVSLCGISPGKKSLGWNETKSPINCPICSRIEAYKNEEVKRALELGFEYEADWQEVGLPSKTQALESAFENYLNSNKD